MPSDPVGGDDMRRELRVRSAASRRTVVLATALALGAGCSGKHIDERRSLDGKPPGEGGAEMGASPATDAGAPPASSRGGAGGAGASGSGTSAPGAAGGAANPTPRGPAPPYAYFYANDVDYGAIYGVPRGARDQAVLAEGDNSVGIGQGFTFDADHVYYTATDATTSDMRTSIVALSATGQGPAVVLVRGLSQVVALAVDADSLYFLDVVLDSKPTASIYTTKLGKISLSGDAGVEALAEASGVQGSSATTYGDYVYWTERSTSDFLHPTPGFVKRARKSGGPVETLATSTSPGSIAVDGTGVYWLDWGHPGVDCIATDGALEYLAIGSDSPVVVASQLAGVSSLVLSGGAAYFAAVGGGCNGATGSGGAIFRTPSAAGPVETLDDKLPRPGDLYIDTDGVYFTEVTDSYRWIMKPVMIPW